MKLVNPIVCIVKLPVLSRTQKYNFHHTCSSSELNTLAESLRVKKLLNFSFKGWLTQPKEKNYELHSSLQARVIQNCVVTSKSVKTFIDDRITRYYSEEQIENNAENVSLDINSKDVELIYKQLDIGAVLSEALCLAIPDYPKTKNAKFEGVTITSSGLKPLDNTSENPFSVLKDFPSK